MADLLNLAKLVVVSAWDIVLGTVLGKFVNYVFSMQQLQQLTDYSSDRSLARSLVTTTLLIGLQGFLTILGYYELRMLFPMSFLETEPIPTLGMFMVYAMFYYQPILWQHVDVLVATIEQWWNGTVPVGGGSQPHN
jgi:hypothetical protein